MADGVKERDKERGKEKKTVSAFTCILKSKVKPGSPIPGHSCRHAFMNSGI
jgi:hypothetical protein